MECKMRNLLPSYNRECTGPALWDFHYMYLIQRTTSHPPQRWQYGSNLKVSDAIQLGNYLARRSLERKLNRNSFSERRKRSAPNQTEFGRYLFCLEKCYCVENDMMATYQFTPSLDRVNFSYVKFIIIYEVHNHSKQQWLMLIILLYNRIIGRDVF